MTDCQHPVWWMEDFALIALSRDGSKGFHSEPSWMRCRDCGLVRRATLEDKLPYREGVDYDFEAYDRIP